LPVKPVDLNLLLHFDALMRAANVSRAAQLIGISQPAMSAALSRLRQLFGDPLLIRSGHAMTPTERALELHRLFVPMLALWQQATEEREAFAPQRASRAFTLLATDYIQFLLLPPLSEAIAREASGIRLNVLPTNPIKTLQLLETNQVELAIGHYDDPPGSLRTRPLFTEDAVCVVRKGHPALQRPWTVETYAALEHMKVTSSTAGTFATALAQSLQSRDLDLKVPLTLSSYLAAPYVAARTDLVATLPRSVAHAIAPSLPLVVLPLPLTVREINIAVYWHQRHHTDPAHRWLRERLGTIFAHLAQPTIARPAA
jgi:DNA-binding transcriptional LysR family regulator